MGRKAEWDGNKPFYESKPSINDWMMRRLGLPIVWGWLIAALAIVGYGIYDPNSVMPMLEGFISLLAIVGTLATLIVTSMLELWKSEQQKEIETMELRMKHRHDMEMAQLLHGHGMETGIAEKPRSKKSSKDE